MLNSKHACCLTLDGNSVRRGAAGSGKGRAGSILFATGTHVTVAVTYHTHVHQSVQTSRCNWADRTI